MSANHAPRPWLKFSGRAAVTLGEVALNLGVTGEHIGNMVADGSLVALDLTRHKGSRRLIRIPIEEYHHFVIARLTGPMRREFLDTLPRATLRELQKEIDAVPAIQK